MKPPFIGFRVVFAVVNGLLWFGLGFGILSGVTAGLEAAGSLTARGALAAAGTVGFFVGAFGVPGAIGGFLGQAASGRFALPPEREWTGGQLDGAWRVGALVGLVNAVVAVAVIGWAFSGGAPSRMRLCLVVAGVAAALAVGQSLFLSRASALGDLRPREGATAPTSTYYMERFALPQGAGNGVITGLIALGIWKPGMPALQVAVDGAATGAIIAFFMVVSAGGLARTDRTFGRVGDAAGKAPSRPARAGAIVAAGLAAGAVGWGVGMAGASLPLFVAWKALLGAVVAGALAAAAARWALSAER